MSLTKLIEKREASNLRMRTYIQKSYDLYTSFFQIPYIYNDKEALEELGIESELIQELLEDFAVQTIQSNIVLHKKITLLKKDKLYGRTLDLTSFRNDIHKNLGVARNLRIKDSIQVLAELMVETDLEQIEMLLEVLEACALKLKPSQTYKALQLIQRVT